MSFYTNYKCDNCPGALTQNPLNGLCEKTCIQVKKVFDASIKQVTMENTILTFKECESSAKPLTFVSAKSIGAKGKIENLQIIDLCEKPNLHRIKCDVIVPMQVVYVDKCGRDFVSEGCVTICQDILLSLPCASIIPFEIEAVVSCVCPEGVYLSTDKFKVTACVTIIMKVVVESEILVPSYGYCPIPPAQEFSDEVCSGFFKLPLFPTLPKC